MTNRTSDPLAPSELDALRESIAQLARRVRYLEAVIAAACNATPQPIVPLQLGSPGTSDFWARCDHVHPGNFDAAPGRHFGANIFTTYQTGVDSENAPSIGISYTTEVEP